MTAFVVATCGQSSTPLAKKTVTALTSLLRYLHITGVTTGSFAFAVPPMAGGRAGPPRRAPEAAQVTRLLSSCDRRRSVGRRDYAILLLLARLGLRAGEVAKLTLDDVDWHHGELIVRARGTVTNGCRCPPTSGRPWLPTFAVAVPGRRRSVARCSCARSPLPAHSPRVRSG